jgi:hypothetical protein
LIPIYISLKALLEPVASTATEPEKIMRDKHISRPHGKVWMTADTFIQILKDAAFQGNMDDLAGGLEKLLVGSENMAMAGRVCDEGSWRVSGRIRALHVWD